MAVRDGSDRQGTVLDDMGSISGEFDVAVRGVWTHFEQFRTYSASDCDSRGALILAECATGGKRKDGNMCRTRRFP